MRDGLNVVGLLREDCASTLLRCESSIAAGSDQSIA